jgi:hypothetical protein
VRALGRPAVEVFFDDQATVADDEEAVDRPVVALADAA